MRYIDDSDILATLTPEAMEEPVGPTPINLSGVRVLVIDDTPTGKFAVAGTLSAAGAEIVFADSVQAARPMVRSAADRGGPFDLATLRDELNPTPAAPGATLRRCGHVGPVLVVDDRLLGDRVGLLRRAAELAATEPPDQTAPVGIASDLAVYPQLRGFLDHFIGRLPHRLIALHQAMTEADLDALHDLADEIKRSAATHGYAELAAAAARLAREADAGPTGQLNKSVDELITLASLTSPRPCDPDDGRDLPPRA